MNEETPIELYVKRNGETVKFVRYEEIERLHSIIKEVREYISNAEMGKGTEYYRIQILQILDKEK